MGVYQFKRLKQNKDMYLTYLERLLLKENASPGHLCVTVTRCDPFALEEGAPGLVVHKTPSWRGCPAQPSSWKHSELLTGAQAGWPWAGTAWGCAPAAEPDPGGCCVACPTLIGFLCWFTEAWAKSFSSIRTHMQRTWCLGTAGQIGWSLS